MTNKHISELVSNKKILNMEYRKVLLSLVLLTISVDCSLGMECSMSEYYRFDCHPEYGASQQNCESRGCCWQPAGKHDDIGIPSCFYPEDYEQYQITDIRKTNFGLTADIIRPSPSYYPKTITTLKMDMYFETNTRLHFKIYDPAQKRFEVPIETPKCTTVAQNPDYDVLFPSYGFGFGVVRKSTDNPIFNCSVNKGGFIFADQFIQISTILPSKYIYGLGEHRGNLLRSSEWNRFTFWNRDIGPVEFTNLYGDHPFYLGMEPPQGNAFGIFLLNSNAMDVLIQPAPAITFTTIGGILDFYIFLGPTPGDVIQQYTEVIGRPYLPPYWGLGFHLCRWGYKSANRTQEIVNRMRQAQIPQDTQWNDIDYMASHRDFTTDPSSFANLPDVLADLHYHKQYYISMIDPAISSDQPSGTYPAYDDGVKKDVFIKDAYGKILIGQVWPGKTAFPDFFKPETSDWWYNQLEDFHNKIPFDGVWLDMNEPSNFVDGSYNGCPSNNSLENPPYTPHVLGDYLRAKTICASAQQHIGVHYNLHNMFGISEVMATNKLISKIRGKRPFIISRSTFPSSGKYGGHWLGDNRSRWPEMHFSITGILNFNMYGIPLVGADICGFADNSNEELCVRWHQLGAFYPFSRNHNSLTNIDQDPAAWSTNAQGIIRDALLTRYRLLPYLYTLFASAHENGTTVARPLFFEFPQDPTVYAVDRQFMWGSSLLISPVLDEDATTVEAFFPAGVWYDFYNGANLTNSKTVNKTLPAPLETINLHIREGSILPLQEPNTTTYASRQNSFELRVAISPKTGSANGSLYWDDGDTIGTIEEGNFIFLDFRLSNGNTLVSSVLHNGYKGSVNMVLGKITIYGVTSPPNTATVNGKKVNYSYHADTQTLLIEHLTTPMNQTITAKWSYQI